MRIAFFSTKPYDHLFFDHEGKAHKHEIIFFEARLNTRTAELAKNCDAVCCFVNDTLDADTLTKLKEVGIKLIALRCAGYNNVDIQKAAKLQLPVVRVPNYSPDAVAEHAVALILSLNRKIHRAYTRIRASNFSLQGLLGFNLRGKTVGVIGMGKIGAIFSNIMQGFGCKILGHDVYKNPDCLALKDFHYVSLEQLFTQADIISLHCPLMQDTYHIINQENIALMKKEVMLINTSRGGLIDTQAAIAGLKEGKIGYLGLDVYEEEEALFYQNLSEQIIQDDMFVRLETFPNVLITSHQAFFTEEALANIARITTDNITAAEKGEIINTVVETES